MIFLLQFFFNIIQWVSKHQIKTLIRQSFHILQTIRVNYCLCTHTSLSATTSPKILLSIVCEVVISFYSKLHFRFVQEYLFSQQNHHTNLRAVPYQKYNEQHGGSYGG